MLRNLYQFMSIKNLLKARTSGQIATLLVLIMVAVLIFILVTVNMGTVSLKTTILANAADSAGLYLTSQMGTRAQQLFEALGFIEKCEEVSWLDTILAVAVAIVVVVVTCGSGAFLSAQMFAAIAAKGTAAVFMGALGGAAGGAIGGAIGGEDVGKSALGGAMVGAAVGGGLAMAGGIMTKLVPYAPSGMTASASAYLQVPAWAGASAVIAGGALIAAAAAAPVYNEYLKAQLLEQAYENLAKALNGLPEEDRFREGAFLLAFSQVVDDPRVTSHSREVDCDGDGVRDAGDGLDTDGDGDYNEEIPCFQRWYYLRAEDMRVHFSSLVPIVEAFFDDTFVEFADFAETLYFDGGELDRSGYGGSDHSNGLLVTWAETLEKNNPSGPEFAISFWQDGPVIGIDEEGDFTREELYHDEIDWVVKILVNKIRLARELRARLSIEELANSWESWIGLFDDGDDATMNDFRDSLAQVVSLGDAPDFEAMPTWNTEIDDVRKSLPNCSTGTCATEICNPCCKFVTSVVGGSLDYDDDDEFTPTYNAVQNIINRLTQFRTALRQLRTDLGNVEGSGDPRGGRDPATYQWTDEQGEHSITLDSNFRIPVVDEYEGDSSWYSEEVCVGIVPQHDKPTFTITRVDNISRSVGILGNWNPFAGTIVRKCEGDWHVKGEEFVVDMSSTMRDR